MAYTDPIFLQAVACTTPGAVWFAIKEQLKLAGWVTDGSGDAGALYSGAGVDHITHDGTTAGGFNRVGAWWAGHFGTRFLLLQAITITTGLATTDSQLRIGYKHGTGFNYGSAGTGTPPTGGVDVLGSVGNGQQFIEWSQATIYLMGGTDQAGVGAFWFGAMENANNSNCVCAFFMEEVVGDPSDTDPVVFYTPMGNNATSPGGFGKQMQTDPSAVATSQLRSMYFEGVSDEWRPAPACAIESSTQELMVDVTNYAVSPYDGRLMCQRLMFGTRQATFTAFKGVAKSIAWFPSPDGVGTGRRQVWTHLTSNDYLRLLSCLVPWDGSVPSLPGAWSAQSTIRFVEDFGEDLGGDDGTGPVITLLTPAAGGDIAATLREARETPITFRLADDSGIKDAIVTCLLAGERTPSLVYDDEGFWGKWLEYGDAVETLDGDDVVQIDFSIRPVEGWRKEIVALKVNGYDLFGNKEGVDV